MLPHQSRKHLLLLLAIITLVSTGCLGPKMVNKWVAGHYGESVSNNARKTDYLTVTSPLVTNDPTPSVTTKQTKNFLPLLVYWQYDYQNRCTLNAAIPVKTFTTAAQAQANAKGLRKKLNGQRMELSVDNIPNGFLLNDRGRLIWVIYAIGWDVLTFIPNQQNMVVSYKIFDGATETKRGSVTVVNSDKTLRVKVFQSLKNAANQYLDQYDQSIRNMSKTAVDQIMAEI